MPGHITLRSARHTYGLVAAVVVTLLVGGLMVPLVFGDPEPELGVSTDDFARRTSDGDIDGGPTATTSATATTAPDQSGTPTTGDVTTGPEDSGPGSDPDGSQPLTASDIGVTESTIKVGVVLLDMDAVEPLGLALDNYTVETQRQVFQAYIDDINASGGINGRHIEAVYVRNDPLDVGGARARCLQLASDHQVFAVLGFVAEEASCLVQEQRRPTIAYANYPRSNFTNSGNYLITGQPSSERMAANWVGALDELGILDQRSVGIVAAETEFEAAPADAIETTLEQLGHDVSYRARLSADADTAMAQLPIEVQRMQSAGVNTVMLSTNFLAALTWVQTAASQGWSPHYVTSEIGSLTADDLVEAMPDSFNGTIGIVNSAGGQGARSARLGEPERPENTACRELYNNATDGPDYAYGEPSPISNVCPIIQIFEQAATAAGPDLTRDGFVAAVQSLGAFPLPTYPGGSFQPGKTDYNDTVQPIVWRASCRCYEIDGPLMSGRY